MSLVIGIIIIGIITIDIIIIIIIILISLVSGMAACWAARCSSIFTALLQ